MVTEYANLCTHIVAPSQSIADLLVQRGVTKPISVIPTGIDWERFGDGDGAAFRQRHGIAREALVVGHVGRLAAEKNLDFLARAIALFLAEEPAAVFVVVGSGDQAGRMQEIVRELADERQLIMAGQLIGADLLDAYAGMDTFAFTSQSETQGLVLVEAMAARNPVIALDGSGVREVVEEASGRLLPKDATAAEFASALAAAAADRLALEQWGESARAAARPYGLPTCTQRLLELYGQLVQDYAISGEPDWGPWDALMRRLEIEWNLLQEKTAALTAAVSESQPVQTQA
jgi:glycosyltransferase involved in cell wall biosynthesis